eukprot:1499082-Prymnesium_polylepis.2
MARGSVPEIVRKSLRKGVRARMRVACVRPLGRGLEWRRAHQHLWLSESFAIALVIAPFMKDSSSKSTASSPKGSDSCRQRAGTCSVRGPNDWGGALNGGWVEARVERTCTAVALMPSTAIM